MSEFPSENKEFRTEKSEVLSMTDVAEASALLRQIAEPRPVGDTVKAAINRAARRVSSFMRSPMRASRAEDIWREEAKAIRVAEMDAIRQAAADQKLMREARNEMADIDACLARLEALLLQDEDFRRDQVAPHIEALSRLRGPVDRD